MDKVKPFKISKHIVMEAFKRVKINKIICILEVWGFNDGKIIRAVWAERFKYGSVRDLRGSSSGLLDL